MRASTGSRILMLLENAPFLLDSRVYPEALALVDAGHQVAVICPTFQREPWCEQVAGVRVYRYPALFIGTGFLGYLWEYGYSLIAALVLSGVVLVREGFDVIHAHNPPDTGVLIAAIYRILGKRFVYDLHDIAPEMYTALFQNANRRVFQALVALEQLSCRLADHIIVTNQSHKRKIMHRSGVPEKRITVVRNGPDPALLRRFDPAPEVGRAGKITICYVGVMGYHDGVDYLLRALHHLIYDLQRTDVFCVLVGRGNAWSAMKALSVTLQLSDYVLFTGWIDRKDLELHLAAADLCVAPEPSNVYNDQCTFIKMLEYMAVGKPIVAFDLPEHRVTAQHAAVYATPNSELDFARKIALLMDDPALRQNMGEIARKRAETELAWGQQSRKLLGVYESNTLRTARLT